jgi:hypothetical protein
VRYFLQRYRAEEMLAKPFPLSPRTSRAKPDDSAQASLLD